MSRLKHILFLFLLALCGFSGSVSSAIIWSGPDVVITQNDNSPGSVTDVLVPGIASLGRGFSGPLCNELAGDACDTNGNQTPSGFAWAFDGFFGNAISYGDADRYSELNFTLGLTDAVDFSPAFDLPGRAGVGHILGSDIYFDIRFSHWQRGGAGDPSIGGGFSYMRSSPTLSVPEPALLGLFLLGLIGVAVTTRRRT